jgi:WD40 repeat protein
LAVAAFPDWSSGGKVTLHDSSTGQARRTYSFRGSPMHWGNRFLAFSPDGRRLALGWGEPMVRWWDVASGRELPAPPGESDYVTAVAFSPDGKTLAAALDEWDEDNVRLWDVRSGAVKASFEGPVGGLAFSPDSRVLATVGGDGCLRLRDPTDGRLLAAFRWHQSDIDAVAFSPDGHWLATGAKEARVKLWPVDALLGGEGSAANPRPRRGRKRR